VSHLRYASYIQTDRIMFFCFFSFFKPIFFEASTWKSMAPSNGNGCRNLKNGCVLPSPPFPRTTSIPPNTFGRNWAFSTIRPCGVREICMIHVGCTCCVTSSTDHNMKIQARTTLKVALIRACICICILIFFLSV
jgi:hypothetical protein